MTMKKKYGMLFTFTFVIILGIIVSKSVFKQSSTEVFIYEVQSKVVEESVTCTGRIESADSKEVFVEVPCIADLVNVKAGDKVNEGDALFSIDVEATKQAMAIASGISPALVPDKQIKKVVTAPVSGVVRTINVSTGEAVDSDTPCVVISSTDALQVKVSIHENNLKNIEIGQVAVVSGTPFAQNGYAGTVTYISPSARQQYSGTTSETVVDAIITLSEKDDSLKTGLTAKIKIQTGKSPESIVVPYEYVLQDDENQEYVYLYENGFARKRIIVTGKELNDGFTIDSGLSTGDKVIKNPTSIDKPDTAVVLRKEGGNANG